MRRPACLSLLACAAVACAPADPGSGPNVLMIVMDDVGVDSLAVYPQVNREEPFPMRTPTIRRLAEAGVVFDNVWSNPSCSPTRATLLTGRYAFRTGVTRLVQQRNNVRLPTDELTIPRVLSGLRSVTATSAAFGKWHLGNCLNGRERHPNVAGFSYFAGQMENLQPPESYFEWPKVVNGGVASCTTYSTHDNVREARDWIRRQRSSWFVYLAFNAAHAPWEMPPHDLLPEGGAGLPPAGTRCGELCRHKMIEAMDHEIGWLLDEIAAQLPRTTIIVVGDNGTPAAARPRGSPYPPDHMKMSMYEGAINVPLIVHGPTVARPGTRSAALVNTTDLFATTIELIAGQGIATLLPETVHDSRSLLPLLAGSAASVRTHAFASRERHRFAIRDEQYKLIRERGAEALYDMTGADRHTEEHDLLLGRLTAEQQARHEALSRALDALIAPTRDACPIPEATSCEECCTATPATPGAGCALPGAPTAGSFESCRESEAACTLEPTGQARCLLRSGVPFECREGSIHVEECPCAGPDPHCASDRPPAPPRRTSERLVCR